MTQTALAIEQLQDLPSPARDVLLAIVVGRAALWLWLASHRTVTAVAFERATRRRLHT
jgi:hypothetical protein